MTIKVNGEAIPEKAIEFELDRLVRFYAEHLSAEELGKQMELLKKKALDQAIGAKLLLQEASRLDLPVQAGEVDARLKVLADNAGGMDSFRRMLDRQKKSMDNVRSGIEQGIKVDKLIGRIASEVADPTEAEMQAHFKVHAAEYARADRAEIQHILIKPASPGSADKDTARSRLLEIKKVIEDGADFSDQAAAYSECDSGRKSGGSLGWLSRGMTIQDFDRVIFALKIGELSDIVETPLGLHLLRKTAQENGGAVEYRDVADKVRDFLRHAKRGAAVSQYVEQLRSKAVIEEG
ncbi:MAG: hypothetical protein C0404_15015 [Verrucomicrobia bacterium]|nr:hypothetical protein [Verrucomicrobiota bacterium]